MKLAFVLLITCILLTGCGEDEPGTPAIPDISGVWSGTATLVSASPLSHCLAVAFSTLAGTTTAFSATITQDGEDVTILVTQTATGLATGYTGTFDGSGIDVTWYGSDTAGINGVQCLDGIYYDMDTVADTMAGIVTGQTITGTYAQTYNTYFSGTSTPSGVFSINGTFTMSN